MKKSILVFGALYILTACTPTAKEDNSTLSTEKPTQEMLKEQINTIDDSLKVLMKQAMGSEDYNPDLKIYYEAINVNKDYYFNYPEDAFSETVLNKIASLFFQINKEDEAAQWRDTLLHKFPKTKYKQGLLELQMSYYGDDTHFNPDKIRSYTQQLLELDDLSEEKRAEYQFRLKHADKTFDELIDLQIQLMLEKQN